MKKTPSRRRSKARSSLVCLLCLALTVCCYSAPVQAAENDEVPPAQASEAALETAESSEPAEPPAAPEEAAGETAQEDAAPSRSVSEPEEGGEAEGPEEGEEIVKKVTLTFKMGIYGTETVEVEQGQYPYEIPQIPSLPGAQVQGWYDKAGNQVSPSSIIAGEDAVYTARWSRNVSDLLNTYEHFAYMQGYNGMFRPNQSVTRAEAAQMLYSLLRNKDWEQHSFSDVGNKWFSDAVGVMAGLGVIRGYTDGTFKPGRQITRAEFVTMAVACDTISQAEQSFPDVPKTSWCAPYVATAAEKGWISGYSDGNFHPDDKITRAQAVTIVNKMLGRSPDPEAVAKEDVKNFYDVFPGSWAYKHIVEASTNHSFSSSTDGEVWTDYEKDTEYPEKDRWIVDDSGRYYLSAKTRKFLRGEQTISGVKYLFSSDTGAAFTGFRKEGAWRRYYKNGLLMKDISGLRVVSGPYLIKVYKNSNYLIVYAKDGNGSYNTPVKAMRVSCGYGTPTGTFYTPDRYRWLRMIGDTWAQWCTQIEGNYLFHSVPNWTQSNMDLEVDEYNHLGETRSLGCVRLCCRDAKWIFDNCVLGTKVIITTSENNGPLEKPAGIQIPFWHSWDPTDPTAVWRCKENGCH